MVWVWVAAVVVVLAAAAASTVGLLRRRARIAGTRIAQTLHLVARWWREHGEQTGELLYVAIGDSAAQGIGASRPARGYVGLIAAHLRRATGRSIRVVNLSISGARVREVLELQLPVLRRLSPDILTVAIGANDIAEFDPERFERELTKLYDGLPPNAIVGELPAFYFGPRERDVCVANAIVHRLAEERGFPVAPVHATTSRGGGLWYLVNRSAPDLFHPNDRGHRAWASAFLPILDRIAAEAREG